jgi:hypothetical protein
MNSRNLIVIGSPQHVWIGEGPKWTLDTTNYGGSPTSVSVTATDLSNGADVTSTVLTGSATVNAAIITLPTFSSAVVGAFQIQVTFSNSRATPFKPVFNVNVLDPMAM